ncbi:hypothetical protein RHSIM_Rhsim03G0156400 [Rhododendron simsii]|uniref:Uncharacterized protein n=1 Tax=Rhododendron simsii TaxID=118357 RepID=A0A834HDW9_RHOSS|nr:hypothetical protein RHSIM_Rhsim03G0156400 [Rhododendron simsii]
MKSSSSTLESPPCQQSKLDSFSAMKKNRAFEFTILSLLLVGALYIFVATPSSFKLLLPSPRSQCNCSTTGANSELEFVKVLMALSHPCNPIVLYLTFEAKDFADGGTIKNYQAVVR